MRQVHATNAIPRSPVVHNNLADREWEGGAASPSRFGALTTRCDGATARREQCPPGDVFYVPGFFLLLVLVHNCQRTLPAEFLSTTSANTAVSDLSGRCEQKPMPT